MTCDFNFNLPSGYNILHQILAHFYDLQELNDILGLISKLTLRYMFQRCHKDRDIRPGNKRSALLTEPKQSSIFFSYLYFFCNKYQWNQFFEELQSMMSSEGIMPLLDHGEIKALCKGFGSDN